MEHCAAGGSVRVGGGETEVILHSLKFIFTFFFSFVWVTFKPHRDLTFQSNGSQVLCGEFHFSDGKRTRLHTCHAKRLPGGNFQCWIGRSVLTKPVIISVIRPWRHTFYLVLWIRFKLVCTVRSQFLKQAFQTIIVVTSFYIRGLYGIEMLHSGSCGSSSRDLLELLSKVLVGHSVNPAPMNPKWSLPTCVHSRNWQKEFHE